MGDIDAVGVEECDVGTPQGASELKTLLGCNTGGLGCCAREAEEFDFVLGRTCDKCSMVRTESDDTIYVCDPRSEKVSDGMTCDAFDAPKLLWRKT